MYPRNINWSYNRLVNPHYEEPEEPKKQPAQRLLETIKNEKREDIKPKKTQMSNEDKKKIQELMKRRRAY